MREQPHYEHLLTKDFFEKHYVLDRKSYPELRQMLLKQGYNIHVGTLCKYAKKHSLGRTVSEGQRNTGIFLDWKTTFLNEQTTEAIDGFILGDGGIKINDAQTSGRLCCTVEHQGFCAYMMNFFSSYAPSCKKEKDESMRQGFRWAGITLSHPDLYQQYLRWYPEVFGKREKQPPDDVRITPLSVMIWYLGDGSMITNEDSNSIMLRISTDSFRPERVEFLASKLQEKGIACHRNGDNRIMVDAKGIPAFFDFIGHVSPVSCYKYKFDVPAWRLTTVKMRQAAQDLGVDYQRLAYLVKIGKAPATRLQAGGKPLFTQEQIGALRELKQAGVLY